MRYSVLKVDMHHLLPRRHEHVAPTIATERLVLRPWVPADAETALSLLRDSGMSTWISSASAEVESSEDVQQLFEHWARQDLATPDPAGHWAIELRTDGRLLGALSLDRVPWDPDDIRMTWALAPAEWGSGYAVEACSALLRWAIEDMGALQVFAVIPPQDTRGLATAERIGMDLVREVGRDRLQVYRIRHGELGDPAG